MQVKSPAKINLSLQVKRHLSSGYHELDTVLAQIPLEDELDFELSDTDELKIEFDRSPVQTAEEDLIWQAGRLLQEKYQIKTGFTCQVKKNIPSQAGLGGGSSNAAAALKTLNQLWQLKLTSAELLVLAQELGADVPFFITGGVQLETNHGNPELPPQQQALPGLPSGHLLLIKPDFSISTQAAFSEFDRQTKSNPAPNFLNPTALVVEALQKQDLSLLGAAVGNDFNHSLFAQYPVYQQLAALLFPGGALNATITGTGSTLYAFFQNQATAAATQNQIQQQFPTYQLFLLSI